MTTTETFDYAAVQERVRAAAPEGWMVMPMSMTRCDDFQLGYPITTYEVEARSGRAIGQRGLYSVMRKVEVTLSAATIEALEAAVRALANLTPFLDLPLDTKVSVTSWDD